MNMNAIAKEIYAEIVATLEQIERTNAMLHLHETSPRPSRNSISNFIELRADYMRQLAGLLRSFDVEIRLPITEAA